MEIKGILVSILAPFENHIANGGEKLLGNASSIKRRPDGRVYVSGQMQRHVLFSAMDRINQTDPKRGSTYVSNGDGTSNQIEIDLRADMGGFMHPSKGDYSGRRTAPLSATPAVAVNPSEVGRDLLIRIRQDESDEGRDQALATREFSQSDLMHMNFFLDVGNLGISKGFKYENSFHLETIYYKHVDDTERRRRACLFLEATKAMNDYANQARNAVSGEPQEVLIVFDSMLSRKASRHFTADTKERENLLAELKDRGATYILGNDKGEKSVHLAYKEALAFLADQNNSLYDPSNGTNIVTFAEAFGAEGASSTKKKAGKKV